MIRKGGTPVEGKRKRGAGRAAPAALAACLCALAVALLAWGPWAQPAPGGGGEPAGGQVYDGPLPFPRFDRPLSQMPRNADGTIAADDGTTVSPGCLEANFGPEGGSEDRMVELVEAEGFECYYAYWHRLLDLGEVRVRVPEGMSEEEGAVALLGIEGVEEVEAVRVSTGYFGMFDSEEVGELPGGGSETDGRTVVVPPVDYGEYHLAWSLFTEAWGSARCDGSTIVALLDTGAPSQALGDLAPNVDYSLMNDATGGDGYDAVGHGTAVASIVSAVADDDGCTGCSGGAKVVPVRVAQGDEFEKVGDGRYDMGPLWRAFEYLLSLSEAPDVVNMSFGGAVAGGGLRESDVAKMQRYVDRLRARDCVCVAASGNDGGFDLEHPFNDDTDNSVNYPAACSGVVSVGSLHRPPLPAPPSLAADWSPFIWLSAFSNTSSDVDLVAFGDEIQALSLNMFGFEGVSKFTGTSFAAPQVAAAAALVKARHPGWSAEQVERSLLSAARSEDLPGFADADGDGRDDEGRYGAGLLDAAAAVGREPASPALGGSFLEAYRESRAG